MNLKLPLIVSLVLVAVMAAFSAWGWNIIPDTAQLPIHWGWNGDADRFAAKVPGLLMMPGLGLVLTAFFGLWPAIEPRRRNLVSSRKLYTVGWLGGLGVLTVAHILVVVNASGTRIDVGEAALVSAAVLIAVMGNFFGKTRSNFTAGIRTPWTISSDYSWERTHRWGGRLFVVTGVAALGALLVAGRRFGFEVLIGGVLVTTVTSIVLSYVYWRRDPARHAQDGVPE